MLIMMLMLTFNFYLLLVKAATCSSGLNFGKGGKKTGYMDYIKWIFSDFVSKCISAQMFASAGCQ